MIDLHCHSTASDGTCSPTELIKIAENNSITHLALTDHDTTEGLDEFLNAKTDITLIPGVELSVDFRNGEMHIVGLFFDKNNPDMRTLIKEVKGYRIERNGLMLEKLSKLMKRNIRHSDIIDNPNSQLGRPHIAKYLLRNGVVETIQDAFERFLGDDGLLSVPKKRISIERAIDTIKSAGGVVVLAHPSTLNLEDDELDNLIKSLKAKGLDAIEVYSSHSPDDKKTVYSKIAEKYGLVITGGSDYHGGNSKVKSLGADLGDKTDEEILNHIMTMADKRRG